MKHKDIERLIQKEIDREISAIEKVRLSDHLAKCPECAQFHREMTETGMLLTTLTQYYPNPGFNARLLSELGLRRRFARAKPGIAFACSWIGALLLFAYSSLPAQIMGRIASSFPALFRFFEKTELVISSLNGVLVPLFKNSLSTVNPALGLVFSVVFIYFLGRALQKEAKCKA
jgi:anti-sigma factor RsiW